MSARIVPLISCATLAISACADASEGNPSAAAKRAGDTYSAVLMPEFCLSARTVPVPDKAVIQRQRLDGLKREAKVRGAARAIEAADAKWRLFLQRAEFTCPHPTRSMQDFQHGLDKFEQAIAGLRPEGLK
jgi:hypothetical protein